MVGDENKIKKKGKKTTIRASKDGLWGGESKGGLGAENQCWQLNYKHA